MRAARATNTPPYPPAWAFQAMRGWDCLHRASGGWPSRAGERTNTRPRQGKRVERGDEEDSLEDSLECG